MPYRSLGKGFVGRIRDVWTIHDSLRGGGAAVIEGVGAVTGAGGIGKSQLAVEYAHRFAALYSGGVFWIDAAQGKTTLIKQLIEGSEATIPNLEQLSEVDRLDHVWKVISRYGSVLVILDDFPKRESLVSWLPPSENIHTLITTRRRDLHVTSVPLDFLTQEEGLALLNTSHRRFGSDGAELVRRLGGLPLAIELAKSYLNLRPGVTVDALLAEIVRVGELHALGQFALDYADELPTGHEKDVAGTFQISWDVVSKTSQNMLRVMALVELAPVPKDLLQATLKLEKSPTTFAAPLDEYVTELNRISLIELDSDGDPAMHSLIRAFVRRNISDPTLLREQVGISLKQLIADAKENHLKLKKIVPHAEYLFRSLASDEDGKEATRNAAIGLTVPLVTSALRLNTSDSVERARSSCTAAIEFLESLSEKSTVDWTPHLQTVLAGGYLNRGNTYSGAQGAARAESDYSRAIELLQGAEVRFGYDAKVAVAKSTALANRAQVYLERGAVGFGMADVAALLDSERLTRKKLGSDWPISGHAELAKSLANLRAVLARHAKKKEESAVRQLLIVIADAIPEPRWETLNALGVLYLEDHEWRKAEEMLTKCGQAAMKHNAKEGLIKSGNNLAISLRRQRRLDEAERVCTRAVELAVGVGELAWECQCLGTLASVLEDKEDYARQSEARKRIREIREVIGDRADENLVDV
jgi:tetratricopeptide (TPR) repeat protein